MLDRDHAMRPLAEVLASLRCEIELPPSWQDRPGKTGSLATGSEQTRRFARRCFCMPAALRHLQTFPALSRPETWCRVYTKDVSRDGLSFLHSEQLFPRERTQLILIDGTRRTVEAVRCRRIQDRCFEVEARFVEGPGWMSG